MEADKDAGIYSIIAETLQSFIVHDKELILVLNTLQEESEGNKLNRRTPIVSEGVNG